MNDLLLDACIFETAALRDIRSSGRLAAFDDALKILLAWDSMGSLA
jgi:hypothetical protein